MSQTNTPHKHQQRPVEDILDFCTLLGSRMIASGANLERVQLAVERISRAYGLTEVSLYLLSTNISLSARDNAGYYAIRQRSIPAVKLQMNRLQSLNSLCYSIAKHTPSPKDLFFYALLGVYNHNPEMVRTNGINCALTLAGMSIGFVLSFVAAHYIRGWRLATSHGYVPGGRRR